MERDELRAMMGFLRQRVHLKDQGADGEVTIGFDAPSAEEMAAAGLNFEGSRRILDAP